MNIKTNRRGRSRQSVNIEGEYYYAKTWTRCEIYDLSAHGAALKLKQSFVVRDKIQIRIGDIVNHVFEARVVNVNGCRTGIAFEDMTDQGKAAIENMISRQGKKPNPVSNYAAAAFARSEK
jgi:hypothetical protein